MSLVSNTRLTPPSFLVRSARVLPDKNAVVCGRRRLTHRGLGEEVTRAAPALRASGIQPGGRVANLMPGAREDEPGPGLRRTAGYESRLCQLWPDGWGHPGGGGRQDHEAQGYRPDRGLPTEILASRTSSIPIVKFAVATVKTVAESLYDEFKEPLYAPPPLLARMVDAGQLGRGIHTYA